MATKRNEPSNEVVKVSPDYLDKVVGQEMETGMESMSQHRILSRLKLVQGMSDQGLKDTFGEGSLILSPGAQLVVKKNESFLFVPVFGFTEYCTWSDRKDKNSPVILERSFDPTSVIAKKSLKKETREEVYEGGFKKRHVEHVNFAGIIYDQEHPLYGTPVAQSYCRGELWTGKSFVTSLGLRKRLGKQVPMWAQVWEYTPTFRDKGDKKWWGINHTNPVNPYILENEIEFFYSMYRELKADFDKRRIVVDHSEGDDMDNSDMTTDM